MRLISLLIKVFLIINFIFISNLSANSFQNLSIPKSIEFKLNNYEYNRYLRRGMRAYVDSEINLEDVNQRMIRVLMNLFGKGLARSTLFMRLKLLCIKHIWT